MIPLSPDHVVTNDTPDHVFTNYVYSPNEVVTYDSPNQVVAASGHRIHGSTHPFGGRFADVRGGAVLS